MSDRFFYPLAALLAFGLIALAVVYPQGIGARSPGRFGHETVAARTLRLKKDAPVKTPPSRTALRGPL